MRRWLLPLALLILVLVIYVVLTRSSATPHPFLYKPF
jgi:hypothetical protein